jgi:hypothetical protein
MQKAVFATAPVGSVILFLSLLHLPVDKDLEPMLTSQGGHHYDVRMSALGKPNSLYDFPP